MRTTANQPTQAEAPLLRLSPERRDAERRRALEQEKSVRRGRQKALQVFWQCIALSFAGVVIYAWSWHLTDPRRIDLAISLGFAVTYDLPFFRWLAYYISESEMFG